MDGTIAFEREGFFFPDLKVVFLLPHKYIFKQNIQRPEKTKRQSQRTWNDSGGRALGGPCDAARSVRGDERRLLPPSTTPPCCKRQANCDLSLCRTAAKFSRRYLKRTVMILTSSSRAHVHAHKHWDFKRCLKKKKNSLSVNVGGCEIKWAAVIVKCRGVKPGRCVLKTKPC